MDFNLSIDTDGTEVVHEELGTAIGHIVESLVKDIPNLERDQCLTIRIYRVEK